MAFKRVLARARFHIPKSYRVVDAMTLPSAEKATESTPFSRSLNLLIEAFSSSFFAFNFIVLSPLPEVATMPSAEKALPTLFHASTCAVVSGTRPLLSLRYVAMAARDETMHRLITGRMAPRLGVNLESISTFVWR